MRDLNGKNLLFTPTGIEYFDHKGWQRIVSNAAKDVTGLRLVHPLSEEELLQLLELTFPKLQALAINFDPRLKSIEPISFSSCAPLLETLTVPFRANSKLWIKINPGLAVIGQ